MIGRLFLPLCLWLGLASCAQDAAPAVTGHPALWSVRNEEGATVGWLFGTVHVLPDGVEWQFAALDDAIAQAGVLVVEVGNLADPVALQAIFERLARDNAPGTPIAARIDPSRLDTYRRLAGSTQQLDAMETWAAAIALAQAAQTGDAGNGADRALIAQFDGRSVVELEGAAQQFGVFDAMPEKEQRDFLDAVLKEAADRRTDTSELAFAWQRGDLATMERITGEGMLADPELRAALLTNRNRAWAAKIVPLLQSGKRPLVAVGAGHMIGADGLPALLGRAGYTIVRLP